MMLSYTDRGRVIAAYRPGSKETRTKPVLLGTIDKRVFNVRLAPKAGATAEEVQKIEDLAQSFRSADQDRKEAVLQFPPASRKALKFYMTKASDADKQLIGHAVRAAARALRKAMPATAGAASSKPSTFSRAPVTPEALAFALYEALGESGGGKVQGEPHRGRKTEIRGHWDLNAVARALLSAAP